MGLFAAAGRGRRTSLSLACQFLPNRLASSHEYDEHLPAPLPDSLKSFVDESVASRGYGTSSEYVRELIRRDRDRLQLRALLLACRIVAYAQNVRVISSATTLARRSS